MKSILTFMTGMILGAAVASGGEAKRPTVLDYYLALPDDVFYCEIEPADRSPAFRRSLIRRLSAADGYLLARVENYPLQVALFTHPGRPWPVVAVNRPCQLGCMCNSFRLLVPRGDGTWREDHPFPSPEAIARAAGLTEPDYELVLPERGTDIKVVDRDSRRILTIIAWRDGVFVLRKKP